MVDVWSLKTSSYHVRDAVIAQPGSPGLVSQPASGFLGTKTVVLILVQVLPGR